MIHQLFHGVREQLEALGYPFRVMYEPSRVERTRHGNAITIKRAQNGGGETIVEPQASAGRNGPHGDQRAGWFTAGEIEISAQSPKRGATQIEHQELCDYVTQAVIVACIDWTAANKYGLQWTDAGYVPESERTEAELPAGVTFRLKLNVARGVYRHKWDELLPEVGEIKAVENIAGAPPS